MSNIEIYNGGYDDEQRKLDQAEYKAKLKIDAAQAKAKQAVLDRLGLTADEATLLFG